MADEQKSNGLHNHLEKLSIANGDTNGDTKLVQLQQLLIDIVLPRHIPYDTDTSHFGQELRMLCRMRESVHSLVKYLPTETVQMFEIFERVHLANSADVTAEEMAQLQPGSTFAMFVRRQNLGFMCYRPKADTKDGTGSVIVSTFHTRLAAKQVYSQPMDVEVSCDRRRRFVVWRFRDFFQFLQVFQEMLSELEFFRLFWISVEES